MPDTSDESKEISHFIELEKLASLKDKGIISEEEYTAKKRQMLGLDTPLSSDTRIRSTSRQDSAALASLALALTDRPPRRRSRALKSIVIAFGQALGTLSFVASGAVILVTWFAQSFTAAFNGGRSRSLTESILESFQQPQPEFRQAYLYAAMPQLS